jgi:hypothetical protein
VSASYGRFGYKPELWLIFLAPSRIEHQTHSRILSTFEGKAGSFPW